MTYSALIFFKQSKKFHLMTQAQRLDPFLLLSGLALFSYCFWHLRIMVYVIVAKQATSLYIADLDNVKYAKYIL